MWLKRCCAIAATVLLLFSVSLQPSFAEDSAGADLYLYFAWPTEDPVYQATKYAVPSYSWGKAGDYTPTRDVTVYVGVTSSFFQPLSASGVQPTIYYAYSAVSDVAVPGNVERVDNTGTAYTVSGVENGTITQTFLSRMTGGSTHVKRLVCRTTLPHNTAQFRFPSNSGSGPGFVFSSGNTYLYGFDFAYVVFGNPDTLALLDEIINKLESIDLELDQQTTLLKSIVSYVSKMVDSLGKLNTTATSILTDLGTIIDTLQELNTTAWNAYQLLYSVLEYVMANGDTLVSIDDRMREIYLLLSDALSDESQEVSKAAQETGEKVMQQVDAERYWKDKNTENFERLNLDNFSFDAPLISGLAAVGGWFSGLWDALGATTVMFTFPLILGVSLVVVGRVARSAGKGNSGKGGDSE